MEALKNFALMLVFLSAAGLIYYFLLPSGKVSQTAKSVLSVFFLLAVVTPLFSLSDALAPAFSFEAGYSEQTDFDEPYLDAAKAAIIQLIGGTVREYTDEAYEVSVEAHIGADRSIEIEQVNILFDAEPPDRGALTAALQSALGFAPALTVREGE